MKLRFWRRKKKIPIIKTKPLIYGNINYGTSGATDLIVPHWVIVGNTKIKQTEMNKW